MLAPFVLDLLVGCSLLMLTGWVGDISARWIRFGHRGRSAVAFGTFAHDRHSIYRPLGVRGDRMSKFVHPEQD
jgi:hypothetical protein